MRRLLSILILCLACLSAGASTFITATVALTNTIWGTSNYNTLTVNGNTRHFTNQVADASTQILTNTTQSGSAANLLNQIATFPFSGVGLGQTAATNVVLKSAADTALTVSVSSGWATVAYVTNSFGTNISVVVPDVYTPQQKTNVYSGLMADINSDADTNRLAVSKLPANIGSTNPVFHGSATVTNDGSGSAVVITGSNVTAQSFTATGTGTNLIGLSRITNVAGGHFLFQPTGGPITNNDDASVFTNLPLVTSFDVPASELFSNNIGDGATLSFGAFGCITNVGQGAILWHTNGTSAVTNTVRFRKSLPWDWDGGTVKVGIVSVCSGTNSVLATNLVYAARAAAIPFGTGLTTPTFGSLARVTNNVAIGAWTNGVEGITAALTVGGSPSATNGILWEIQRHGGDGGDTETNYDAFILRLRVYYKSNTRTNFPASSP